MTFAVYYNSEGISVEFQVLENHFEPSKKDLS